jgi:hypothetical protein
MNWKSAIIFLKPLLLHWPGEGGTEGKCEEEELRWLSQVFSPEFPDTNNEELHNLYSSPSIIRMVKSRSMRWAGNVVQMGSKRNTYRRLVGKPEGKSPLGRPRRR